MEIKNHPPAGGEENKKRAEILKIKINKFFINYFNYSVFSLSVIILAAGLFILIYPKYQRISKANEEAENKLRIEYETKSNYLNSIRNLKESYQLISDEDRAKIAATAPDERDTGIVITEIESIAARNGAILTSVKIEPQVAASRTNLRVEPKEEKPVAAGIFNKLPQGVGLIKTEVSLSSVNYPVLKNIIKAFENNLRLFDIAKVSFNSRESRAVLSVYSYYLSR